MHTQYTNNGSPSNPIKIDFKDINIALSIREWNQIDAIEFDAHNKIYWEISSTKK